MPAAVMFNKYFGLRGQALSWAIGAIAGIDFLLFGYGMYHVRFRALSPPRLDSHRSLVEKGHTE